MFSLSLHIPSTPESGGQVTRDEGQAQDPHHVLLHLIHLLVLPLQIFKGSVYFFQVYLSISQTHGSGVQVLVPAMLFPLFKYKDLALGD